MRGTKEGGVDIFGFLEPAQFLHPAIWKRAKLRVFCQVKKGRISEQQVRQFKNDMNDLAHDRGRAYSLLPAEMKTLSQGSLGGLFTAQGFTAGADKYGRESGFFLVDPQRIIEVLIATHTDIPGLIVQRKLVLDARTLIEFLERSKY